MHRPAMDQDAIERAAIWLADAFESGNALAPLPPGLAPDDTASGEAMAGALLDRLGLVPCGLRLALGPRGGWVAGPMLEGRLLPDRARLPLVMLRHATASAAVLVVLAQPLDPDGDAPAVAAAIHPAIDFASSRLRDGPSDDALQAADLGGLGHVVAGRGVPPQAGPLTVALATGRRRPKGVAVDLAAAIARAAAQARRLGGLPAGGLLVIAGLGAAAPVDGPADWTARFGPLGSARATLT